MPYTDKIQQKPRASVFLSGHYTPSIQRTFIPYSNTARRVEDTDSYFIHLPQEFPKTYEIPNAKRREEINTTVAYAVTKITINFRKRY